MVVQQNESSKRHENKKSGTKIMVCIFVTMFLGVAGIVFLTSHIRLIEMWQGKIMEVEYKDISYMDNIEQLLHKHEALVFEHMVAKDKMMKVSLMKQANDVRSEINDLLVAFDNSMKGRMYESFFHTIYSAIGDYFSKIDIIFEFSEQGEVATAEYYMNMTLVNNITIVNENVENLKNLIHLEMDEQNEQMFRSIRFTRKVVAFLLIVIIGFTFFSCGLCGKLTNRIVNIDPLTGIYNADAMEGYMFRLKKMKKLDQYASVLINIRDFNYLNRQYGTYVGDCLLNAYGQSLNAKMSKMERVSRQSGDTFMALVKKENVGEFLKGLKKVQVEVPVGDDIRKFELHCRCAVYPIQPESSVGDVINNVSMTLNNAKRSGKQEQVWFSEERYKQMLEEKEILAQFTQGIQNEEFVIYYQPKVDARTKQLCGCEALVRWFHEGQMVPPGKFIPVLESEGKVVDLDFYVFEHVCRDIAEWVRKGIEPVRISSNFSKLHLQNKNLAEDILNIMRKYDINPQYVELELTESSGYDDLVMLKKFVKQMNEAEVHTSMDDFGTGYSSLSMLKDVDVDVVKLDKSFLNGVDQGDAVKEKMIAHLIHMIRDLDRTVVCEGVETEKEFEFLKEAECDMIQGYLFDRPLPHDEFEQRLMTPRYSI